MSGPISSYVFDAYGTLFDVHSAVRRHADKAGPDGRAFSELWRAKQLEYSWVLSLMGAYSDFWKLTEESLDFAFARYPSVDPSLRNDLLDAYWKLDCYPEVPAALKHLKDRGARLAILSNGSPAMLEAAVKSAALDVLLDDVVSVDAVRKYKTSPSAYELITMQWRLYPSAISFQSSNRWDVAGAVKFGMRGVWINRSNQPDEYRQFPPALILPSLQLLG
ncbi:MAG: haloacid dehalogenase type II [Candidatus Ochrobactrum gambitense]|nr:MAG: haloacid dehalogenase type II [Candidatus Ochrobactrum gambitense]WEK16991.1 MAG: haloacid dehalogenase type II [Candidatus Ochrobactrum gambitense]